ncbi:alpha-amylase family protein [Shewanella sp. AS16]|uniref:alpha-amylase family protein n=1 Tax=Shewanella sp. AS16 TaxID=2907625 RepID=UPI001F220485|nr:alpha-amylase family protein [Shewanella sp. AS16]MCE9687222.1 alpha-amylase family protein [Shewanella sp. AS16]
MKHISFPSPMHAMVAGLLLSNPAQAAHDTAPVAGAGLSKPAIATAAIAKDESAKDGSTANTSQGGKPVVYQVFTRLYGNKQTNNRPWGTKEENGVGKFSDIDDAALDSIRELGVSHIWYTGVPQHALLGDYSAYGIDNDDADVVKGRAGSPYAVKDYYNVDPDLAEDPAKRLQEFEALIARTHKHGMRVIMDIVPNHVARRYHSSNNPAGVSDFGAGDDSSVEYARHNNFYYVVGKAFEVPDTPAVPPAATEVAAGNTGRPSGDGQFAEMPAKWTGNGSRLAKPAANDWYETVKINYGVRPDGSRDFPPLPADFALRTAAEHYAFWLAQDSDKIPDAWKKFRDISQFWLAKGVDGFRYDMAEMVPVEFWSYLNSQIKHTNPDAFLLAEVYNPALYRDYIHLGKMDYLYDKVDLYDTLRAVMQAKAGTAEIAAAQAKVMDIESHLLHFLENHDEQRIASPEFLNTATGNAFAALPAMTVSATLGSSPTLVYFGQEVGEDGSENAGFGQPSRTSIFDYIGVPAHQRWMNGGKFDGGKSTPAEKRLRDYYLRLLNLSRSAPALSGEYYSLDAANRGGDAKTAYDAGTFAFARYKDTQKLVILSNFDKAESKRLALRLPAELIARWQLQDGSYPLKDLLQQHVAELTVTKGLGSILLELAPLASAVLELPHKP